MTKIRPRRKLKLKFVKFSSTFRCYFSSAGHNLLGKCVCSADSHAYCVLCDCVELGI